MKQIKLLSLIFMAILSLTGALAATASAEELPNILPEGTEKAPLSGTSKSGLSVFGNGVVTIEAEKSTGLFSSAVKKLGTFDVLFEKSFLSEHKTEECKGLQVGEKPGSILVLGTFHIRHYNANPGKTLFTAIIFLIKEVHILCAGPVEVLVNGCVAGLLLPENKLAKVLTADLKVKKGDNEIITVLNETSTGEETCQLLSKTGAGVFKLSAEETKQELEGFKQKGAAVEVLVMPL
jgi:hypothetical protein